MRCSRHRQYHLHDDRHDCRRRRRRHHAATVATAATFTTTAITAATAATVSASTIFTTTAKAVAATVATTATATYTKSLAYKNSSTAQHAQGSARTLRVFGGEGNADVATVNLDSVGTDHGSLRKRQIVIHRVS